MALTHTTAVRNALAEYIAGYLDSGCLVILDDTTVLATFTLGNPAFDDADEGIIVAKAIAAVNVTASGTADGFQVQSSDETEIFSGTVTVTGGGGDLELTDVVLVEGESLAVSLFKYEASD
jgi:hypothetical protein